MLWHYVVICRMLMGLSVWHLKNKDNFDLEIFNLYPVCLGLLLKMDGWRFHILFNSISVMLNTKMGYVQWLEPRATRSISQHLTY